MKTLKYMVVVGFLAGCSFIPGLGDDTPAKQLLAIEQGYATVFVLAAQYENLPRCTEGSTPICSDQEIVNQMRDTHVKIKKALDAAWVVVRLVHPKETDDTKSSIQRAETLIAGARELYESVRGIITGSKEDAPNA